MALLLLLLLLLLILQLLLMLLLLLLPSSVHMGCLLLGDSPAARSLDPQIQQQASRSPGQLGYRHQCGGSQKRTEAQKKCLPLFHREGLLSQTAVAAAGHRRVQPPPIYMITPGQCHHHGKLGNSPIGTNIQQREARGSRGNFDACVSLLLLLALLLLL